MSDTKPEEAADPYGRMKKYWGQLDRISVGVPKGWRAEWKKALQARKTSMAEEIRKLVAWDIGAWKGDDEEWRRIKRWMRENEGKDVRERDN